MHVLVVGAGVTGLLTAIRCARAGHRVTVLDRGPIPNPAASSFDQHRAIRALDPEDAAETRRVAAAHRHWIELESLLGTEFYRRVGVVTAWPAGAVDGVLDTSMAAGLRVSVVERPPPVRFPAGTVGVLEHDAGVLLAEQVLRAAANWLSTRAKVELRPWSNVSEMDVHSGRIRAGDELLDGDLVLLATGPWSRRLVSLPMVLYRQAMIYLRPAAELGPWWERAPSAGRVGVDGRAWLLPPGAGTLLKISSAALCREVGSVDEPGVPEPAIAELPGSVLTEPQRYTVTAVRHCHYLVDACTGRPHLVRLGPAVLARTASGGDGFRTAPLVAERIAETLVSPSEGATV